MMQDTQYLSTSLMRHVKNRDIKILILHAFLLYTQVTVDLLYLQVMQKVFALLLAELRKLGASIIFANFSKVIIDTGKCDISAARAYCDSLVKTLQNR